MKINLTKLKKISSTNFVENLKDPPPRHNGHSFQGVARNQPELIHAQIKQMNMITTF